MCHKGHKLSSIIYNNSYCDCGLGSNCKVSKLPKEGNLEPNHVETLISMEFDGEAAKEALFVSDNDMKSALDLSFTLPSPL